MMSAFLKLDENGDGKINSIDIYREYEKMTVKKDIKWADIVKNVDLDGDHELDY